MPPPLRSCRRQGTLVCADMARLQRRLETTQSDTTVFHPRGYSYRPIYWRRHDLGGFRLGRVYYNEEVNDKMLSHNGKRDRPPLPTNAAYDRAVSSGGAPRLEFGDYGDDRRTTMSCEGAVSRLTATYPWLWTPLRGKSMASQTRGEPSHKAHPTTLALRSRLGRFWRGRTMQGGD